MSSSKYRKDPRVLQRVLNKVQPFTEKELLALELPLSLAFEKIKAGTATEQNYWDLHTALRATEVRAKAVHSTVAQAASEAVQAMKRCKERFDRLGVYGFDGPAIDSVFVGIDLHGQFIRNSTPLQMKTALEEAIKEDRKVRNEQRSRKPLHNEGAATLHAEPVRPGAVTS